MKVSSAATKLSVPGSKYREITNEESRHPGPRRSPTNYVNQNGSTVTAWRTPAFKTTKTKTLKFQSFPSPLQYPSDSLPLQQRVEAAVARAIPRSRTAQKHVATAERPQSPPLPPPPPPPPTATSATGESETKSSFCGQILTDATSAKPNKVCRKLIDSVQTTTSNDAVFSQTSRLSSDRKFLHSSACNCDICIDDEALKQLTGAIFDAAAQARARSKTLWEGNMSALPRGHEQEWRSAMVSNDRRALRSCLQEMRFDLERDLRDEVLHLQQLIEHHESRCHRIRSKLEIAQSHWHDVAIQRFQWRALSRKCRLQQRGVDALRMWAQKNKSWSHIQLTIKRSTERTLQGRVWRCWIRAHWSVLRLRANAKTFV